MNSTTLKTGFGTRLKEERKRLGQNQTEFSESAGVKRVSQYLYEHEENVPNYRYFQAISILGVDIHYILFGYRFTPGETLHINLETNIEIYNIVDELARDKKGNPLPLKERAHFFRILTLAYNNRDAESVDRHLAIQLIAS